ncbi:hypothetical protein C8Q76DRAFT_567735, partial [Earliella scabrosa]
AFLSTADLKFGPITQIRRPGQRTKKIPWTAFQFSSENWKRVKLCADILADANRWQQASSTTYAPTLHQVIPALETLASRWEAKMEDERYAIYHDALAKGHAKLVKYYKQLDNARAYILSLYLHPYYKLAYIESRWGGEAEYLQDLADDIPNAVNWQEHAKKVVEDALREYWPKRLSRTSAASSGAQAQPSSQETIQQDDDDDSDEYDRERRRRIEGAQSDDGWKTEM